MKTYKLEVTREVTAVVYVTVPDKYTERDLVLGMYQKAINQAIDEQRPEWDKDYDGFTTSVETVEEIDRWVENTDISGALEEEDERVKRIKEFRL
jgi:hypothetical protein